MATQPCALALLLALRQLLPDPTEIGECSNMRSSMGLCPFALGGSTAALGHHARDFGSQDVPLVLLLDWTLPFHVAIVA